VVFLVPISDAFLDSFVSRSFCPTVAFPGLISFPFFSLPSSCISSLYQDEYSLFRPSFGCLFSYQARPFFTPFYTPAEIPPPTQCWPLWGPPRVIRLLRLLPPSFPHPVDLNMKFERPYVFFTVVR